MAKFLSSQTASSELENLVRNSQGWLCLICPSVNASENLFQCLKSRADDGVMITLIYKTGGMGSDEKQRWFSLKDVCLRQLPNLHASCVFNTQSMIIGSLNSLDKSAQYSREMDILITDAEDNSLFTEALQEVKSIVASSIEDANPAAQEKTPAGHESQTRGYCIRCGNVIPFDLKNPFCAECHKVWAEFENPDYVESFCHSCGSPAETAMSLPQCKTCRASSNTPSE